MKKKYKYIDIYKPDSSSEIDIGKEGDRDRDTKRTFDREGRGSK